MSFIELFLLAVGLSMDAFSVSICKGLGMRRVHLSAALALGLAFGGFQAFMPVIGWALGSQFLWLIEAWDHWIAFGLLLVIGVNMIREALSDDADATSETSSSGDNVPLPELLMLAVATSIDALSVGVAFASLSINIVSSACLIGITTLCFSVAGAYIGHLFGNRWERPAQIGGGVILILIGTKVLIEHLGLLAAL